MTTAPLPIRRALISVSDKTGLLPFAQFLVAQGVELLSTGGTAALLKQHTIPVRDVSEVTGFPEMMDGRVKTLHPRVHGGLLARRPDPAHMDAAKAHGIGMIDLLVVNLYPFETTLNHTTDYDELVENIDIGGPAMIRAAAKNHESVTVIVDVADYAVIEETMKQNANTIPPALAKGFAAKAFARTAAYDTLISSWLTNPSPSRGEDRRGALSDTAVQITPPPPPSPSPYEGGSIFPDYFLDAKLAQTLRYGENPHQAAALYQRLDGKGGIAHAQQLQGKELSYNNLADAEAAWGIVCDLGFDADASVGAPVPPHPLVRPAASGSREALRMTDFTGANKANGAEGDAQSGRGSASAQGGVSPPSATAATAVLIKHANPCGVAVADTLVSAFTDALASDPVSAFGGILAVNQPVDAALVEAIGGLFLEVFIAPEFTAEARALLAAKKNLRLLVARPEQHASPLAGWMVQAISGGYLVQQRDLAPHAPEEWKTATGSAISDATLRDAILAWQVTKHVKSNAIVLVKNGATIGVGAGQMSRVDSVRIAIEKARQHGHDPRGAVLASDAFFPFADNVELAAAAGIATIIQPGGSVRDSEVIDAANTHGIAMLFTGRRHFKH